MNERFIFHQKMNERLMSVKLFLSMINETGNLMEEFIIRLKKIIIIFIQFILLI